MSNPVSPPDRGVSTPPETSIIAGAMTAGALIVYRAY